MVGLVQNISLLDNCTMLLDENNLCETVSKTKTTKEHCQTNNIILMINSVKAHSLA